MVINRIFAVLAVAAVSACASPNSASRARQDIDLTGTGQPGQPVNLTKIEVRVPDHLISSESNAYYPMADIVWREDPIGDRHQQVQVLVSDGLNRVIPQLSAGPGITADIQITRFHAVTQRTRYTIGGFHEIGFLLTLFDATSGAQIAPPRQIRTSFGAYGGEEALAAERRGETQKVRIQAHLENLLIRELTTPGGSAQVSLAEAF